MSCINLEYTSYGETIPRVLECIGAKAILKGQKKILIKPNLVNNSPHPVTTPPECCESLINYVKACSDGEIILAEGCGAHDAETPDIFTALGYDRLAAAYDIPLVDLNQEPLVKLKQPGARFFPEMYLPGIMFTHYIISVPVLKAHSLAIITGSCKNMMGFAPPRYYSGPGGVWKKSRFHDDIHQAVIELNRYRKPDLSIMDASVGLSDYHLGGPVCSPPVNKTIAGFNPLEVDRQAATCLGLDWKTIPHLSSAV